jgi:hypothetical protein
MRTTQASTSRILIAANVAALAMLAFVELSAPAGAQASRVRSTYTAAAGRVPGTETHAVYVVDETTQEVVAIQWDPQAKQVRGLGFRNFAVDAATLSQPRSN